MTTVVLDGAWDKVIQKLESYDALFEPLISRAVAISLQAVQSAISVIPAQPSRTRSKHFNTYVRGTGSFPKSAFVPSAGTPGGFKVLGKNKLIKAGRVRMTSQDLPNKFRMTVTSDRDGNVIGDLHNSASYSGWVNGPPGSGTPHQVKPHQRTGWVNSEQALAEAMPQIKNACNTAMRQLTKEIAGGG